MTDPPALEFEDFFREEFPGLCRALFLLVGDRGEAEDLAQEAMARTCERWDRVRAMDSPDGYLFSTAFNLNRSRLRRLAVRTRRVRRPEGPADALDAADDRMEVRRALAGLSREQREAVVLVDWIGMSTEEAGRLLKIEPVSVRGRLHRARQELRSRLGEQIDE